MPVCKFSVIFVRRYGSAAAKAQSESRFLSVARKCEWVQCRNRVAAPVRKFSVIFLKARQCESAMQCGAAK